MSSQKAKMGCYSCGTGLARSKKLEGRKKEGGGKFRTVHNSDVRQTLVSKRSPYEDDGTASGQVEKWARPIVVCKSSVAIAGSLN
jgi:hypothetical protein